MNAYRVGLKTNTERNIMKTFFVILALFAAIPAVHAETNFMPPPAVYVDAARSHVALHDGLLLADNADSGVPVIAPSPAPAASVSPDDLSNFFKSVGGWMGMGALGIVMILVQGGLLIAKAQLGEKFLGKYQLLIVLLLSYVGGALALKLVPGTTWGGALLNPAMLASLQVVAYQIFKQFTTADAPSAPAAKV